jgi:hypothetical protein
MFNQSIFLIECNHLYNILYEMKSLFTFNISNFEKAQNFIKELEIAKIQSKNCPIIVNKKISSLFLNVKINQDHILLLDEFPIKIEKLLDKINTHLIKQKYNFQSNLNIKDYILNLNSRIISNSSAELKLTEREIDIILFLNDNKKPQSINTLQNKVWGHSFELETHTVETHIYRLRKKIKDKFKDINFIISNDHGYEI